jgi:hypothetical protein
MHAWKRDGAKNKKLKPGLWHIVALSFLLNIIMRFFPKGFLQFHEDINKGIRVVCNKSNRIVKIRHRGTFKLVQIFSAVFRVFGNASVLSPYINNDRQSTNIIHDMMDMTL